MRLVYPLSSHSLVSVFQPQSDVVSTLSMSPMVNLIATLSNTLIVMSPVVPLPSRREPHRVENYPGERAPVSLISPGCLLPVQDNAVNEAI